MDQTPKPAPPREREHALPLADLDGARLYSVGWGGGGRVLHAWFELADGKLALATFEPGKLGQDTRPRVVPQ
jgi:hypothetical protein